MKEARITINLSEYEGFKRTINKKNEYINECVINGKIKRNDVTNVVFYKYLDPFCFHNEIRLVSEDYKEYITSRQIDDINNEEFKKAITEICKYKKEWEADYKSKVSDINNRWAEINNKSWVDRLHYLFTGNL